LCYGDKKKAKLGLEDTHRARVTKKGKTNSTVSMVEQIIEVGCVV